MDTEKQLKRLSRAGLLHLDMDADPAELWENTLPSLSPNELLGRIEDAVGTRVALSFSQEEDRNVQLMLHHGGDPEDTDNYFDFSLSPDHTAKLNHAYLENGGSHIAKRYLSEMADILREEGYGELQLEAREVGAYAWAQHGFKPQSQQAWDALKKDIIDCFEKGNDGTPDFRHLQFNGNSYELTAGEAKVIKRVLAKESPPEAIWEIPESLRREVDTMDNHPITVGKAMLIDKSWDGVLALDETDRGFERFQTYCDSGLTRAKTGAYR